MKVQLKNCEIETVVFDSFRLDGGAMFGSVPKNLWQKRVPTDNENCIPLVSRSLLISTADRKVLVDVGLGDYWTDKQRQIFSIAATPAETLPFSYEDITDIILTHLHFDHAGGLCDSEGAMRYPNATLYIQSTNFETALNPNARERASYLGHVVSLVENAPKVQLTGSVELFAGITVEVVNGHTQGMQWLRITDGETTLAFPSDLIPTAQHVSVPYCMGYDMCVQNTLEEKTTFLERAVREDWLVVFQHDSAIEAAKIVQDSGGRYSFNPGY